MSAYFDTAAFRIGVSRAISLFINAVDNRDMPVVQTITILAAAIYVVLNLLADLATIAVTPRLRTEAR